MVLAKDKKKTEQSTAKPGKTGKEDKTPDDIVNE
jgi:hypothetical protein